MTCSACEFWRSSIGKKIVMAVTGFILFGFLCVHLAGNLLVFAGADKVNAYARFLHEKPILVWATRLVLLLSLGLHFVAMIQLRIRNRRARPEEYAEKATLRATIAGRTMVLGGVVVLLFVVYHLLHYTIGVAHPSFVHGDVYRNVIVGFSAPAVSAAYVAAMIAVGLHLRHGLWSMFQSVGLNGPRLNRFRERFAISLTAILVLGNVSIPVSVLAGWVK